MGGLVVELVAVGIEAMGEDAKAGAILAVVRNRH